MSICLSGGWVVLCAFSAIFEVKADIIHPSGSNTYQQVTGDDPEDDRRHWDAIYKTKIYVFGKEPSGFLRENIDLLPIGTAFDIAMGEGRNGVYLAKKGFKVDGIDISEVALKKAKLLAKENGVSINTIYSDLNSYNVKPESYDVVLNINFLSRTFIPQIKKAVKRGGYVVYENETVEQLKNQAGLRRDFLLEKGELKRLFKDFEIVVYKETNDGKSAAASLIARKPKNWVSDLK